MAISYKKHHPYPTYNSGKRTIAAPVVALISMNRSSICVIKVNPPISAAPITIPSTRQTWLKTSAPESPGNENGSLGALVTVCSNVILCTSRLSTICLEIRACLTPEYSPRVYSVALPHLYTFSYSRIGKESCMIWSTPKGNRAGWRSWL